MTMTLRELRAWHEDKYNTKFLSREEYQVHFDAIALIDAHLSQPQPVAQGEAASDVIASVLHAYDEVITRTSDRESVRMAIKSALVDQFMGYKWGVGQATLTIPTGHRVAADSDGKVSKYKDALNDIRSRVASGYFVDANHLGDIAKKALEDESND
jgi:hypothetical protein